MLRIGQAGASHPAAFTPAGCTKSAPDVCMRGAPPSFAPLQPVRHVCPLLRHRHVPDLPQGLQVPRFRDEVSKPRAVLRHAVLRHAVPFRALPNSRPACGPALRPLARPSRAPPQCSGCAVPARVLPAASQQGLLLLCLPACHQQLSVPPGACTTSTPPPTPPRFASRRKVGPCPVNTYSNRLGLAKCLPW